MPTEHAIEKILDLPEEVLKQAETVFKDKFEGNPSFRKIVRVAVEEELGEIIQLLTEAGVTYGATGNRGAKRIDNTSWDAIENATLPVGRYRVIHEDGKIALSSVALLRACIVRFANKPNSNPT